MRVLVLGLILFFLPHSVAIVSNTRRDAFVARAGEAAWKTGYSLLSALGLVLIVWGYGLARQDPVLLYVPPVWLRHVALLMMLFVFPLLLAAYLPARIKGALTHPMLVAVLLWALAHLLANGTLADLVLFGSFLLWAGVDLLSMRHRPLRQNPAAPAGPFNDAIAILGGLLLYLAFVLWLHRALIGVPVLV
jgi:uncharacterized membrane protein